MSDSLVDVLIKKYNEPDDREYSYNIGDTVRIKKSLDIDTHNILDLLGRRGIVDQRYTTGLHKDHKYLVKFSCGRIEPFDETELDYRFGKRKKK